MKFTECLNDTWDYFFLGDPSNISKFKSDNDLSDDLMSELTSNDIGDSIVENGVLIPLSGIANYPYHILFSINSLDSVFTNSKSNLQFKKNGYLLEVIDKQIFLMTIPYLKDWTEKGGIESLLSNGLRPKVNLDNGLYTVEILGGETYQESGWEPTIEFVLQNADKENRFTVNDVNFSFFINSKEY